jgi:hypothetical protein
MQVPAGKRLKIPFSFVDASGNVAKVDGTPEVTSPNLAVTTTAEGDGFVSVIDTTGFVGAFSISGLADVDLGEGKKELTFSLGDHEAMASPEATAVKVGDASVE